MLQIVRTEALKLITAQLIVLAIIFILWCYLRGVVYGVSAVVGGLACVIPSIYFISKLFAKRERETKQIVRDFYLGEAIKLLSSAVLLVLIIKLLPVKLLAALSGFIGAYLAIWLMPLLFVDRRKA